LSFLARKKIPLSKIIPDNYVDIHSHLIPAIDDGVKTIYQAAFILEEFEKMGVTKMITTPHVMQQVWPNSSTKITNGFKKLESVLPALGITKIDLKVSAEYMMDDLFFELLKKNDILPLHKNYILVEMSTFSPPINLKEILFEIKVAGYIPILAHPERYTFYHEKDLKKYAELKQLGFLFQINLLSLSGHYGESIKNIATKLIDFFPKIAEKITPLMKNNQLFA